MIYGKLSICPQLNFHCNARITRIGFALHYQPIRRDFPYFQIWRPSAQGSKIYKKISEIHVNRHHIVWSPRISADIPLTGSKRIFVQSGDVIGYYHPTTTDFRFDTIRTEGYELYEYNDNLNSVDLNSPNIRYAPRQPLMNFTVGELN